MKYDPQYKRESELTHIGLLICFAYLLVSFDPQINMVIALACTCPAIALTAVVEGGIDLKILIAASAFGTLASYWVYGAAKRQNRPAVKNAFLAFMFPVVVILIFGQLRKIK